MRTPLDLLVDPVERRIIERNVLRLDVTGLDEAAAYQQLVLTISSR